MQKFWLGLLIGGMVASGFFVLFEARQTSLAEADDAANSERLREAWADADAATLQCAERSYIIYKTAEAAATHAAMCVQLLRDSNAIEGDWDPWPSVTLSPEDHS